MLNFDNKKREFDFWLKSKLSFSPPMFKFNKVKIDRILSEFNTPQKKCYDALTSRYKIEKWSLVCSGSEFLGNLCFLELLDHYLGDKTLQGPALDIGSRNFWYAPALKSFYQESWTGVEVDAYQRYLTGHTRKAYAEYMVAPFPRMQYQAHCLTQLTGQHGLITWFLPYILSEPMEASGLPDRFFDPMILFEHVWQLLAPEGHLFIINQEQEEAREQEKLLQDKGITYEALGLMESVFSTYQKERFGFLVTKNQTP